MNVVIFICLVQILSLVQSSVIPDDNDKNEIENLREVNGDKFYYFGYGSNMLTKRIHIQNPTAVKIGAGVLDNYRLDFNFITNRWQGSAATVVEHLNRTVQGTLWEIDLTNMDDIDNQEGVHLNIYKPLSVSVRQLSNNKTITARVYLLVKQPVTDLEELERDSIPLDRQPSKTYLQCLVKGAIESGIEEHYIKWLKSIKHNGKVAEQLENDLELKDVELDS
ncbi:gamma-glutamylcyclotransferase-like [Lucilia sericata]|uniref:gamma-glutamylcyclotransferase-like n=1 Tax=Lucilia sericata TaxID=13632 RepID=UPI0018A7F09F|nr:gamma-glutamylcyclotransferase-like [Lucilia sericata]